MVSFFTIPGPQAWGTWAFQWLGNKIGQRVSSPGKKGGEIKNVYYGTRNGLFSLSLTLFTYTAPYFTEKKM